MQDWQRDPVDLAGIVTPRGVELPMTSGKVGLMSFLVLGWGAPSRTLVVVRLPDPVEEMTRP